VTDPTISAVVTRVLPAPPSEVFDEWLDPQALAEFISPYPSTAGPIEVDPQVGGHLRIVMLDPEAAVTITGEYLELERPHRLRFTWDSDFGSGFRSVVTVSLEPHGDGQTLMTIEHAQLPPEWRDDHERGWALIASQLERRLAAAE
jgi:uncharacterized protein YndB with AHSA1/START domain